MELSSFLKNRCRAYLKRRCLSGIQRTTFTESSSTTSDESYSHRLSSLVTSTAPLKFKPSGPGAYL